MATVIIAAGWGGYQQGAILTWRTRKQFSTFKGTCITGWFGDYKLSGTPELLDLLYETGLGAKNSEGFGMFSVDA